MMIPAPSLGMNAKDGTTGDGATGSKLPVSGVRDTPVAAVTALAYTEFAGALKDALRDFHRTDLLAQNPLLRSGIGGLNETAGPPELKALLSQTVSTLFGNARDEKLCRVIELTYFQPALKQEVVADRLSLPFGTYRRHLTAARDRLARWLWESVVRAAPVQPAPSATARPTAEKEKPEGETTTSPEAGDSASPRLSIVVLPFINIGGGTQDDHFVDGITETLTTDLSRTSGVFVIFSDKNPPRNITWATIVEPSLTNSFQITNLAGANGMAFTPVDFSRLAIDIQPLSNELHEIRVAISGLRSPSTTRDPVSTTDFKPIIEELNQIERAISRLAESRKNEPSIPPPDLTALVAELQKIETVISNVAVRQQSTIVITNQLHLRETGLLIGIGRREVKSK